MGEKILLGLAAVLMILGVGQVPRWVLNGALTARASAPETVTYQPSVSASGKVTAPEKYDVVASGTYCVAEVRRKTGETVRAGEIVAVLTSPDSSACYAVVGQEEGYDLEALQRLAEQYGMDASAVAALSGGSLAAAEKTETQTNAYVTSPVDGVVTSAPAPAGSVVTSGTPVFSVCRTDGLTASVDVNERHIGELSVGDPAEITVEGVDKKLTGTVTLIHPVAEQTVSGASYSTTVKVEIALDAAETVRPGSSARAVIRTGEAQRVLTVPYDAVMQDEDTGNEYVYLYEGGSVIRREIVAGRELASGVQVTRGVGAGETVLCFSASEPDGRKLVRLTAGESDD